jgi:NodT family efflux transporter outer membrane factor (OMF) lipoprotein
MTVGLGISLTSCMVGPDFHRQPPPQTNTYTESKLPAHTVGTSEVGKSGTRQKFILGQDIPAEWWRLFHSHAINELVRTGMNNSPNIAAAYAALRQAQENFNAQIGNALFPAFSANVGAQRELFSAATFGEDQIPPSLFNLFNATVNVSYTLDVFGGARRQIEALGAQIDYQQFQLLAAYLSMTANIVTTAVTIASLQAQIDTTRELIHLEQGQLDILNKQYHLGGISLTNVMTQQTLVAQTRAKLPALEKLISQNRHALSALVGAYPSGPLPEIKLNSLTLPRKLPVSIPSNMVRQRPDIRAAEATLHAASAKIGVATANLFPQFAISGNYGWQAGTPSTLFGTSTNVWTLATSITQPLFQGGALFAQRRAAIDAYQQTLAQYKGTILQALQNVADSLRALETDARTLHAQKEAERAASMNLKLAQQQYFLGGESYITLLNAQQQYQQTKLDLVQAEAAPYTDTAALFQALGGGWWNKEWCIKECL